MGGRPTLGSIYAGDGSLLRYHESCSNPVSSRGVSVPHWRQAGLVDLKGIFHGIGPLTRSLVVEAVATTKTKEMISIGAILIP